MRMICIAGMLLVAMLSGWTFPKVTSGVGLGVMYAGAGINVEDHFSDTFSAAVGVNPFSGNVHWTLAGLYRPEVDNKLRFSAGISNSVDFFNGDQRSTQPFLGIGWVPTRQQNYRGWNVDIIFGSEDRSASLGYSF